MSGSRLGRGRSGRLAVYGGCGVVVVLLIFLYRAATSEMARLRELHVQCAHQHEALAAQLQVIFEYKVRLEKSLAEEKSANAAVKQALQQRATEEKSRHDKDSNEAMQKFKSLQQDLKLLQSEHEDLQEEYKKRQKQALDEAEKLKSTLQELRVRLKEMNDEKHEYDRFKSKYLALETDKTRLQEKYDQLQQNTSKTDSTIEHLNKKIFQMTREFDSCKKHCKKEDVIMEHLEPQSQQQRQQQESPQKSLEKAVSPREPREPTEQQQQQQPEQQPEQQQQQQQQQKQQSSTTSSSARAVMPALKVESSTRSSGNFSAEPSLQKALPIPKPQAQKVKLPVGVVPIPMIDDNRNVAEEMVRPREEAKERVVDADDKAQGNVAEANREGGLPPAKHFGGQILDRQENLADWRGVQPGIQEFGDEPNHFARHAGLEDGGHQGEAGDDQYAMDYYKEPHPKNNDIHIVEGEDEGEDEDDPVDYQNNNPRQDKHE